MKQDLNDVKADVRGSIADARVAIDEAAAEREGSYPPS
jgi:hypothetical protein